MGAGDGGRTGHAVQNSDDHGTVGGGGGSEGGSAGAVHVAVADHEVNTLVIPGGVLHIGEDGRGAVLAVALGQNGAVLDHQQTNILRAAGEVSLGVGHGVQIDGVQSETGGGVGAVGPVQAVGCCIIGHGLAVIGIQLAVEGQDLLQSQILHVQGVQSGGAAEDGVDGAITGNLQGEDGGIAGVGGAILVDIDLADGTQGGHLAGDHIQGHQLGAVVASAHHVHGVGGGVEGHVSDAAAQVADLHAVPQTGNHGDQVVTGIHGEDIAACVLSGGQSVVLQVVAGQGGDLSGLGIDGDPAVEGVIVILVVHDTVGIDGAVLQLGQVVVAGEGDLIGVLVGAVVTQDQQELSTHAGDIQLHGVGAVAVVDGVGLLGHDAGVGGVHDEHISQAHILGDDQLQEVALGLGDGLHLHQLRSAGIHGDGDHHDVAVQVLGVDIIVAGGGDGQVQLGAVGNDLAVGIGEVPGLVVPGVQVGNDLAVSAHEGGLTGVGIGDLEVDLAGLGIGPGEAQGLGAAHQGDIDLGDVIQSAVAVGGDNIVGGIVVDAAILVQQQTCVGVEAQHPVGALQVGPDSVVVLVGGGHGLSIPEALLVPVALVQDGSSSPVAVEAHEGQAQVNAGALGVLGIDEALDEDAVGVMLVHPGHILSGQLNGDLHTGEALGSDPDAVLGEGDLAGQGTVVTGHELDAVINDVLGQQAEIQLISLLLIAQIANVEEETVGAGLVGIVTQLSLGALLAGNSQVSLSGDGSGGVHQTCTLLTGRSLHAGSLGNDGLGGGHQQRLSHIPLLGVSQVGELLCQVLQHQSGGTGQLGSGHGGAGHQAVLAIVVAGVHVAADGGDLRLQLQRGGNAPAGEVAHLAAGLAGSGSVLFGDGQDLVLGSSQDLANSLGNGSTGNLAADAVVQGAIVVGHLQVDQAGLVVVDDDTGSTSLLGVVQLQGEVDGAAGDDGDLALNIQTLKIGSLAQAGNHDILHLLTSQGTEVNIQAQGIVVSVDLTADGEVGGQHMAVIGRSNRQRTAPGGGGADNGGIGVIGGVLIGAPDVAVGGLGLVTGGDGQNGVEILHTAIDGVDLGILGGEAGGCAQGHVDDIHIQQQSVLDGGHQVILISTAVGTEDLHDDDLCLGSDAHHGGGVDGVGGGDTGDMGAVVALIVIIVGSLQVLVNIVEGEGDLVAVIQILSGGCGIQLSGLQLAHDSLDVLDGQAALGQNGGIGERGMIQVETGIHNGDLHALALVAQVSPDGGQADHVTGGGGSGIADHAGVINGHQEHGLDAVQLGDVVQLAKGHIGGDGIGQVGELIADIQLLAQHLLGDGVDELVLGGQHLGLLGGGDSLDGHTGVSQGLVLQHDEGGNHLVLGVELGSLCQLLHALGQFSLQQVDLGNGHLLGGPGSVGVDRRIGLVCVPQSGDLNGLTLCGLVGCGGLLAGGHGRHAGNSHVQNQTQSQQHRQYTLEIHVCSSFYFLTPRRRTGCAANPWVIFVNKWIGICW